MDVIVSYELTKEFGDVVALDRVNLQIPEGQAYACIGGNNAGKTTVVKLLTGLYRPTSGECSVLGFSPFFEGEKLHAVLGTVLDSAKLYRQMTLSENLLFFSGIHGVDNNDAIDRMSFLLHKLDIWESRDLPVDDLPTGVLQRSYLARALMHRPKILLMDEPTESLDKETTEGIQELVDHLVLQEGVTVLLCTKNMEFAQQLCDGFAVLKDGVLLARGDLEGLRQGAGVRYKAALRLGDGQAPPKGFRKRDGYWQKEIDSEDEMPGIIFQTIGEGKSLYEARLIEPTLEEIYNAYLEGGRRRAGAANEQDDGYAEEWNIQTAPAETAEGPDDLPQAGAGQEEQTAGDDGEDQV